MFAFNALVSLVVAAASVQGASIHKRSTTGRATFYDVGLGNCGWTNSGSENVVALNTAQYGSTSQKSSHCGQTITINHNGKSEQATIVDSCPTCPYGALDLSKSLFSKLTDGNMGLGETQISWSWGSGSSGSSSSKSSSNKSSSKSNDNSSKSSNKSSSNNSSDNNDDDDNSSKAPSNTAQKTSTGTPSWWNKIENGGCPDVKLPEGVNAASIGPGDNAAADDLPDMCGKWIQVWNTENNKSTKVMMTSYYADGEKNSIYLSDAYKEIADMNGETPEAFSKAKWGFLN